MKRVLGRVAVIVVVSVAAVGVGAALASSTTKTKFTANYSGKVTEVVNGDAVTATPKGNGNGTLIGKSSLSGTVSASTANPPCSPLGGPGLLKGAKSTLKFTIVTGSRACAAGADDQNNISFSGSAKVTGGTGALKKAKGTLRFSGHYDRGTGAFTVKLTGTLSH